MGVRNSVVSTSGPSMAGVGLVYTATSYTMSETASASTTLVMLPIPAGSRIVDVNLNINNDALDATGGGRVFVCTNIALADPRIYIATGSGSLQVARWNPKPNVIGLRHSASANLCVQLHNFVNTGTAATIFTVSALYDTQLRGD